MAPRWAVKAIRSSRYRSGLRHRAGFVPPMPGGTFRLWIHCASVGEAAVPSRLVAQIGKEYPHWDIVFSSFTDTGVRRLRKLYPEREVFYYPVDLSWCVYNALKRIKPSMLLLVEQEIWPNMLLECDKIGIPTAIINGRMNERSSVLVRCLFNFFPGALSALKLCCVRNAADVNSFKSAGIEKNKIKNTGSLKYEAIETRVHEPTLNRLRSVLQIDTSEKVVVAGSTHSGEEEVLADIGAKLRHQHPDLRLLIAPRHVERAESLAVKLRKAGHDVVMKTKIGTEGNILRPESVLIIDTIGELTACYALGTVIFVGRSLFPPGGGQNIMEPAALGRPVIVGSHTGNFRQEVKDLASANAVKIVSDEIDLESTLDFLLSNEPEAHEMGQKALKTVLANSGATSRTMAALRQMIAEVENEVN